MRAMRFHCLHQRPRARIQRDKLQHALQVGLGHPEKKPHALAQAGLELKLPAHGPLRQCCDLRLDAFQLRHLIDGFLADDGGIHVGDEHAFLAPLGRLRAPIDGPGPSGAGNHFPDMSQLRPAKARGLRRFRRAFRRREDQVHGLALGQPAEFQRPVQVTLQRRRHIEQQFVLRRDGGDSDRDFHDELGSGDELAFE